MAEVGYIALLLALVVTVYTLLAFIVGIWLGNERLMASAKGGTIALAILTSVASTALFYLLIVSDFSVEYVASYTSTYLPLLYKISAFWAGNQGSLLLWLLIVSVLGAIIANSKPVKGSEMIPYASAIIMAVALFFVYLVNFVSPPFMKLTPAPQEGMGLNPLLQNPGMFIHPTTQYIGYAGFTVPYAFAMSALILRKSDDAWIKLTRFWTLFAWVFLSVGMIFGGQWAYVELGWGGYWAWDPVENASLMPWLTGTAFFHSVMIQEKKGMLKVWNIMLIIATFLLSVFGTFLTRSGILASVHAFSDSTLGSYFLVFLGMAAAGSIFLTVDRLPYLREENEFESLVSKESSFLLNNLLLVGIAFTVFWGTVYPLISEAITGEKVSVQAPFFNTVSVPIFLVMIVVMGICPLIAWRRASMGNILKNFLYPFVIAVIGAIVLLLYGITRYSALISYSAAIFVTATILLEFIRGVSVRMKRSNEGVFLAAFRLLTRNRRRYGGYIVHLAIIMMAVGITGSSVYKTEVTGTVNTGESIRVPGGYELKYEGLKAELNPHKGVIYTDLEVYKNGQRLGKLRTAKEAHHNAESLITEVGIMGSLKEDLFVILAGFSERDYQAAFQGKPSQDPVTLKIYVNPLVAWIWIGEYVLVIGTVFAMWPGRRISTLKSSA